MATRTNRRISVTIMLLLLLVSCGKAADNSKKESRFVNAAGGLRMRATPETTGDLILLIPDKSEVTILETAGSEVEIGGKAGKWTKVSFQGKSGWIFGGFLTTSKPNDDPLSGVWLANNKSTVYVFYPNGGFALNQCEGGHEVAILSKEKTANGYRIVGRVGSMDASPTEFAITVNADNTLSVNGTVASRISDTVDGKLIDSAMIRMCQ